MSTAGCSRRPSATPARTACSTCSTCSTALPRRRDDHAVLDTAATWAMAHLDADDAMLTADETGHAKSSTNAIGAAHQHSYSLDGIGPCQVGRPPHLRHRPRPPSSTAPCIWAGTWAADEERRAHTGLSEESMFATKTVQTQAMLTNRPPESARVRGCTDARMRG